MSEHHFGLGNITSLFRGRNTKQQQEETMKMTDIRIHPAVDNGVRQGRADFAGGRWFANARPIR